MLRIRNMTMADYPAVYALWLSCPGMGLNDLDDSEDGIRRYLERNPDTCFVAEGSAGIVGVIVSGHDGRRGYIYHTAVSPVFQKQGIGTRLVEAALDSLQTAGIHKAALVAFARNEAGNAFWERMGFTPREDLLYRNKALTEIRRIDT